MKTTSVGAYRGTLRISLPIRTEPASPPRAGPCARAPLSPPAAPASFLCACGGSRFLWPLSPAYGAPVTSVTVPGGGRVGVPVPATLLPRGSALRILESPRRSPPQTALRLAVAPACTSSRTCLLAVRTTSSGCHARRPAARAAPRLRWVLGCRAGAGGAPACRGAWCLGCGDACRVWSASQVTTVSSASQRTQARQTADHTAGRPRLSRLIRARRSIRCPLIPPFNRQARIRRPNLRT